VVIEFSDALMLQSLKHAKANTSVAYTS